MSNVSSREGAAAAAIGIRSISVQGMHMTAPVAAKSPECANWLDIGLSQNRASDTFKHQNSEFGLPHMSLNLKLYSGSRPARLLKGGLQNINSN